MKEPYYTIKEASERVGVESHVLRYWEEELKMDIHRNQMGHRYYTDHDIELLCKIRELKDKGLQLRAIRNCIERRKEQLVSGNGNNRKEQPVNGSENDRKELLENSSDNNKDRLKNEEDNKKAELVTVNKNDGLMSNEEKLEQFQKIMNRILSNAIMENNKLIGQAAGEQAADSIVNKISGMTKEQEKRAEERYRKLDQTLRELQLARKEVAAAGVNKPVDKRKQQRMKRKNKQHAE